MDSRVFGRAVLSTACALLLSGVLAGQSMAAAWTPPIAFTSSGEGLGGGLVALPPSVMVAAYRNKTNVVVKRTTDSGATWGSSIRLSRSGGEPAISGRGAKVDVVWRQSTGKGQVIRYARSINRGASFARSIAISAPSGSAWFPSVSRGANGLVAVAWYDKSTWQDPQIRVRVSRDGGASFGPVKTLARVSDSRPKVAVGKDVIYVAYVANFLSGELRMRRSTNAGSTWRAPQRVGGTGSVSISADGCDAYVAFAGADYRPQYRRTSNKGASWTSPRHLSPASGLPAGGTVISLGNGVVRATFSRKVSESGELAAVFYRQSADGVNWTKAEQVSPAAESPVMPAGVGFAGRTSILFSYGNPEEDTFDVYAATRMP